MELDGETSGLKPGPIELELGEAVDIKGPPFIVLEAVEKSLKPEFEADHVL